NQRALEREIIKGANKHLTDRYLVGHSSMPILVKDEPGHTVIDVTNKARVPCGPTRKRSSPRSRCGAARPSATTTCGFPSGSSAGCCERRARPPHAYIDRRAATLGLHVTFHPSGAAEL